MLHIPSENSEKNTLKNFTFPIFVRDNPPEKLPYFFFWQFECLKYKILVLRSQWNIKNSDVLSEKS